MSKLKAKKRPRSIADLMLPEIRNAFADYVWSEGCSCCQDREAHEAAATRLGELLDVRKYPDGGYDFGFYRKPKAQRPPPKKKVRR